MEPSNLGLRCRSGRTRPGCSPIAHLHKYMQDTASGSPRVPMAIQPIRCCRWRC
jgi:hypothetical protein